MGRQAGLAPDHTAYNALLRVYTACDPSAAERTFQHMLASEDPYAHTERERERHRCMQAVTRG
jgi:hypothetical protein